MINSMHLYVFLASLFSGILHYTSAKEKIAGSIHTKDLIGGRIELRRELGRGKFGMVYSGVDIPTSQPVAVKFVTGEESKLVLLKEYKTLVQFNSTPGICRAVWYGTHGNYSCLAMERVGPSMSTYIPRKLFNSHNAVLQAIGLAISMLTTFESFHDKGLIHRDVRPVNMAGSMQMCKMVSCSYYLIDFDASAPYITPDGNHVPYSDSAHRSRPGIYKSVYSMIGIQRSRRDDMMSLGYSLVHIARGYLPWYTPSIRNDPQLLVHTMQTASISSICSTLPGAFYEYFDHIMNLGFYDRPNYKHLRKLFIRDKKKIEALSLLSFVST